jgi:cyclophilin family peptidyl-prolyl cis-trans isomerase/HEAT repeat protein
MTLAPLAALWLAAAPAPVAPAAPPSEDLLAVLGRLEATRDGGDPRLAAALASPLPAVRARAVAVLGALQAPSDVPRVLAALADPEEAVRAAAAAAAGQFGLSWQPLPDDAKASLQVAVQQGLAALPAPVGPHEALAVVSLQALGKLGRVEALDAMAARLADPAPAVRRQAALAVGLVAYAQKKLAPPPALVDALASLLAHDPEASVRYGVAYALMRTKDPSARAALVYGLKDGDAAVRAACARGLGDLAEPADLPYLVERAADADLVVEVEAARALGKQASRCPDPAKGPCAAATSAARALDALTRAWSKDHPERAAPLTALLQEKLPVALKGGLQATYKALSAGAGHAPAFLACTAAAALDRLRDDGKLPTLLTCTARPELAGVREGLAVHTLAASRAAEAVKLKAVLALPLRTSQGELGVCDVLSELAPKSAEPTGRLLVDLESPDALVALSAADALGKRGAPELVPHLARLRTLAELHQQDDVLAALFGYAAALSDPELSQTVARYQDDPRPTVRAGALAVRAKDAPPAPPARPRPLRDVPALAPGTRLLVQTSAGSLVLDLKPGATAASIAALARQGFYDGLQWHRVVPGFVVQGGDPRGDGAGGPGYTIPCELDLSPYGRGAVGMALSGKDTGGSQWFITLSPQPHLEGHYTVFAQVASGMEVADQLVEGDAILKVTVQAPAPGAPPQLGTGPAGR